MDRALIVHVVGWGGTVIGPLHIYFSFLDSISFGSRENFYVCLAGFVFWLLILAGDELVTGIWFLRYGWLGGSFSAELRFCS